MNDEILRRIRTLARWIVLLLAFAASPAYAAYVCPSGPGPGEVQVGMSLGGNGVVSVPVCESSGDAQSAAPSYSPPPVRQHDVYMAVVAHPDTSKVWPAAGYRRQKAASNAALDACKEAMGEGCWVAQAWSNGATIVGVVDAAGNVFAQGAESPIAATQAALSDCNKHSTGCHIDDVIRNSPIEGNYFPTGPIERRVFASVARPKGTPPPKWDDSAWLASGQRGFKAAEQAALSQCQQDTGMKCEVRVDAASHVARILDETGHLFWIDLIAPQTLDKQLRSYDFCDNSKGHACRLIDTFDVHTPPRTTIIEISKSGHPARGFFSLARPTDEATSKAWGKYALVTGASSLKAAQDAAVRLCEARSHARCEAMPQDGDRGVDQFLILLRDSEGKAWLDLRPSAAAAQSDAGQICAKHSPPCQKSAPVDLGKPVSTVLTM